MGTIIQTTTRAITVKESLSQVKELLTYQWLGVTELVSSRSQTHTCTNYKEEKVMINRDYIIELSECKTNN